MWVYTAGLTLPLITEVPVKPATSMIMCFGSVEFTYFFTIFN